MKKCIVGRIRMEDRFHRAARDGYLDLLREATRQDCDRPDEDGMTPTIWAAYHGNLDALRLLISRGGNPDKADLLGNSALHCAAANGHMNCVSFLVNFGANLWSLDNDFHTALDIAACNEHMEIVKYMDMVVAQQSARNRKVVQKLKEKAILSAQKRIKHYNKLQTKAGKKALKEDKMLAHQRELMDVSNVKSNQVQNGSLLRKGLNTLQPKKVATQPKLYSDYFTINGIGRDSKKSHNPTSGVAKRVMNKKNNVGSGGTIVNGDFKILENDGGGGGRKSVRSLKGLRRDSEVLYVKNSTMDETDSTSNGNQRRRRLSDVFDGKSNVSRSQSEPEFNDDSGVDSFDSATTNPAIESASLFERPGFGSFAFFSRPTVGAMLSIPIKREDVEIDDDTFDDGKTRLNGHDPVPSTSRGHGYGVNSVTNGVRDNLSIGTLGSLAVRVKDLPWDDDEVESLDDDAESTESSSLELFLVANNLAEFLSLLTREKIDLDALLLCTDDDLKEIGVPLGPRRKILDAVQRRKDIIHKPGTVVDSYL
ncbi:pre-mRNA splicing regulator USH1G-like [Tubulanus polymorphus]|uniref:pre-mRNA splicing regulator USH1G-like n=1 Tax=Tubulanus polymorphus TaxID=672921 RepID=UPI003DA5D84A